MGVYKNRSQGRSGERVIQTERSDIYLLFACSLVSALIPISPFSFLFSLLLVLLHSGC